MICSGMMRENAGVVKLNQLALVFCYFFEVRLYVHAREKALWNLSPVRPKYFGGAVGFRRATMLSMTFCQPDQSWRWPMTTSMSWKAPQIR